MSTKPANISDATKESIRKIGVFSSLSDEEIQILIMHARFQTLDTNDFLFHEGDVGDFFAVILEGQVEIEKKSDNDIPVAIATLSQHATLGEMAIIDSDTRSASAIALTPTTLFILSRDSFDALVNEHPKCGVVIIRKIASLLNKNLRNTSLEFAKSLASMT